MNSIQNNYSKVDSEALIKNYKETIRPSTGNLEARPITKASSAKRIKYGEQLNKRPLLNSSQKPNSANEIIPNNRSISQTNSPVPLLTKKNIFDRPRTSAVYNQNQNSAIEKLNPAYLKNQKH